MQIRLTLVTAAAVVTALLVSACGGLGGEVTAADGDAADAEAASASADPDAPSSLAVEMGEWFFKVDAGQVGAGEVTVTADNVGDIDHELILVKTDLPADQMPMTPEGLDAEKAGQLVIGEAHGHGDAHDEGAGDDEGSAHDEDDGHHDGSADSEEVSDAGAGETSFAVARDAEVADGSVGFLAVARLVESESAV